MDNFQVRTEQQSTFSMLRKGMAWVAKKSGRSNNDYDFARKTPASIKEGIMESREKPIALQQITLLLIEADSFVKAGDLAAALEKIRAARIIEPNHLYAIAYEERVKGLIQSKEKIHAAPRHTAIKPVHEQVRNSPVHSVPAASPGNGRTSAPAASAAPHLSARTMSGNAETATAKASSGTGTYRSSVWAAR